MDVSRTVAGVTLVLVAVAAGAFSFSTTIAAMTRTSAPDVALRYRAGDAGALAAKADAALGDASDPASLRAARKFAEQSLARQPFNPRAVRVLGALAGIEGNASKARAAFELADRFTRRDVGTQMWLIEQRVAANDVRGALAHYDIALRTAPTSGSVLFPILDAAMADAEIRTGMAGLLRMTPPWIDDFAYFSASQGSGAPGLALVLASRPLRQVPLRPDVQMLFLSRLADLGAVGPLARYFRSLPEARAQLLKSPTLSKASLDERVAPIAWQLSKTGGVTGEAISVDAAPAIRGVALESERGRLARKLLYLPAGRYRLSVRLERPAADKGAVELSLGCATPPVAEPMARAALSSRQQVIEFVVPGGCPAQTVQIDMAAESGSGGSEVEIRSVELARIG